MTDNPFDLKNIPQSTPQTEPQEEPAENPFSISAVERTQKQQLQATLQDAVRVPPEKAARAARLSRNLQVYADPTAQSLADLELQDAVMQADKKLATSPKLAKAMREGTDFARQSHDDIEPLSKVERSITDYPRSLAAGAAKGVGSALTGAAELLDIGARAMDAGYRTVFGDAAADALWFDNPTMGGVEIQMNPGAPLRLGGAGYKAVGEAVDIEEKNRAFDTDVASAVGQITTQIAAAIMTGGNSLIPIGVSQGAGEMADRVRADNAGQELTDIAVMAGAATGLLEKLPIDKILSDTPALRDGLLRWLGDKAVAGGLEATTEIAQGIFMDVARIATTNPEATIDVVDNFYEGGVAGTAAALLRAAMGLRGRTKQPLEQAAKAEADAAKLSELFAAAAESRLKVRNVESFAQFVQQAADETEGAPSAVYVDARTLADTLQQAGVSDAQLAELLPTVPDQLRDALATDGTVELPIGDVTARIAGTPLEQVLLQHMRVEPDGLSQFEAAEAAAEAEALFQQAAQSISAQATDLQALQQSSEAVKTTVLDQLNATKRFRPEVNDAYATLVRDFYTATSVRLGLTPDELYARYPLRVIGAPIVAGDTPGNTLNAENAAPVTLPEGVSIREMPDGTGFEAVADGKVIGRLTDNLLRGQAEQINENANVDIVAVDADRKGQGIGRALYAAFNEKHGGRIAPSGKTTREAWAVWKRNYPAAVEQFVQQEATRIAQGADPQQVLAGITDPEIAQRVVERPFRQTGVDQTQTPEFKAWFGDSKVVDADGKPLVVYHGTNVDFVEFDKQKVGARDPGFFGSGFYFTPNEGDAQDYAAGEFDPPGERPAVQTVVPVYLSLQNPFVWDMSDAGERATKQALAGIGISRNSVRGNSAALGNREERQKFNTAVRALGHDGVVVRDEDGILEVVAFEPTQIKSAIGNSGTFDPNDPNILRQRASVVDAAPLEGLPATVLVDGQRVTFGPFAPAAQAARTYMERAGLPYVPPATYVKVDEARAKRIADAFEAMPHAPEDPQVKAAYDALVAETLAQWQAVKETGLVVEFITGDDPYGNPRNAILDVVRNNHLWVYPTTDGFGGSESADVDISGNPLLSTVPGETISGRPVLVNDIFRIVHDYFGHIKNGVGFRADGEENAWRAHWAMFTPLARAALTTETRGQNSWVNFGPFAETNRTASGAETQYAPQKIGLLPVWAVNEGASDVEFGGLPVMSPTKGVHFSKQARPVIDGRMHGMGFKGLESERLAGAEDKRLAERVYFYIDEGNGIRPEAGVGGVAHEVQLPALYDAKTDRDGLWSSDLNLAEQRILDAGYGGYYVRQAFNGQGAAVVIGEAARGMEAVQIPNPTTGYTPPAVAAPTRLTLTREQLAALDEQALQRAAPSARIDRSFVPVRPSALFVDAAELGAIQDQLAAVGVLQQRPLQTDTPEFKAWFGDSKVVDADGKPLVVHHGTVADYDSFRTGSDLGAHLGTQAQANAFVQNNNGRIVPAYLSIKNPLRLEDRGDFTAGNVLPQLADLGIVSRQLAARWSQFDSEGPAGVRRMQKIIEGAGYDGVVYLNRREGTHDPFGPDGVSGVELNEMSDSDVLELFPDAEDSYIAFRPEQIKSATGNDGSFDANDPSILSQGPRGTFNPSTLTINLLEAADLSTFLHETGHFFLEVMADIASQPNAPADIQKDMSDVLAWFGVTDLYEWNTRTLDQKRPYHEKFAESFERYLLDGKAPSVELNAIFGRFRSWLLSVYRSLKNFMAVNTNAQLSDEVRAVFDRMLATDEQITLAEQMAGYEAVYKTADEAGMTPEEWADYQAKHRAGTERAIAEMQSRSIRDLKWSINARSRALRELQRETTDRRKAMRLEVQAEVRAMPVYAVQRWLKTGKMPDGVTTVGGKLSTAALREMYGDNPASLWRYLATNMVTNDKVTGLHPNVVAEMFGFANGDALVREIVDAFPEDQTIDGITEQRLLETYGEAVTADGMEAAANEAIHNEARARAVATEIATMRKALGQREGKVNVLMKAARQFAEQLVARRKIKDLKPSVFTGAEARAGKKAQRAMAAGDQAGAATAKRDQLLNHYAAKNTVAALREVERGLAYLKKFDKESIRKNVDNGYLDQIDQLLERFDLRVSVTQRDLAKRASLREWLEAQREIGLDPSISRAVENEAYSLSYKEMPLEEFRGLVETVKNIEHLGRLKEKLLRAKDERDFTTIIDEITATIYDSTDKRTAERLNAPTKLDRAKDLLKNFSSMHRKLSSLIRQLDGFKDGGPLWRAFGRSMNEAADSEQTMIDKSNRALADIFKPMIDSGKLRERVKVPGIRESLTLETRLAVALNWGNDANRQRVLEGDGWSQGQVEAILSSLTNAQLDFVQKVWDHIDSFWPAIKAKEERLSGTAPDKVEASSFTVTVDGKQRTMRGGYYPIKYDTARSDKAGQLDVAAVAQQMKLGAFTRSSTRRGHLEERAERGLGPVRKDIGVVFEHVNQVVHDLAWHEWLIDANRIVRDARFRSAVRDTLGPEVLDEFVKTLPDIAAGDVPAASAFERGISHLRNGTTVAGMGWNLVTAMMQPLGLTQSMARIGPKWVAKGMARWVGDAAKMESSVKWMVEHSEFMRQRVNTLNREVRDLRGKLTGSMPSVVQDTYFWFIMKGQIIADLPTWFGQYEKTMAESGGDEQLAFALADQAVRDSQGGGNISDLARIQRGGPLQKLFTNFYSYFSTTFNLLAERTARTSFKDPLSVAHWLSDFLLVAVAPSVLVTLLKTSINAALGGEEDEEALLEKIIREQIGFLMGTMVGLRELSAATNGFFGYSGPAGTRFFSEFAKLGKQIEQGEADIPLMKALNNSAGILLHYPAGAVNRFVEGAVALQEGETSNPAALVFGPPRD